MVIDTLCDIGSRVVYGIECWTGFHIEYACIDDPRTFCDHLLLIQYLRVLVKILMSHQTIAVSYCYRVYQRHLINERITKYCEINDIRRWTEWVSYPSKKLPYRVIIFLEFSQNYPELCGKKQMHEMSLFLYGNSAEVWKMAANKKNQAIF